MRVQSVIACTALTLLATSVSAAGDDWKGEAELGVLITSGNTDQSNLNGRLGLTHEVEKWRNQGELRSLYSSTNGTATAERYSATGETDYKFADRQFWYLRGAYDAERFSGYDYRSSVTTGYGNRVWQSGERSFLDLTVGAGYRYNRLAQPDQTGRRVEDEAVGRLGGELDYALSPTALFRQKLSTEIGVEANNTTTESETSLQATLVDSLSMKVAYRVKHISDPPAGSVNTDTETSLSLLYGF